MNFLIWAARSVHVFSAVVWLGGLLFQAAVSYPVARVEGNELHPSTLHHLRRFLPFVWMCVWSLLVSGLVLMFASPRFLLFQYNDLWSIALGLKQLTFAAMVFFSFGYARMFARTEELVRQDRPADEVRPFHLRMLQFGKINVALAIGAILLAAAMV